MNGGLQKQLRFTFGREQILSELSAISVNDDFDYPELKAAVLNILNGKVKPTASFIPAKK